MAGGGGRGSPAHRGAALSPPLPGRAHTRVGVLTWSEGHRPRFRSAAGDWPSRLGAWQSGSAIPPRLSRDTHGLVGSSVMGGVAATLRNPNGQESKPGTNELFAAVEATRGQTLLLPGGALVLLQRWPAAPASPRSDLNFIIFREDGRGGSLLSVPDKLLSVSFFECSQRESLLHRPALLFPLLELLRILGCLLAP